MLHIVLIRKIYENAIDFPVGGSFETRAPSFVFCEGPLKIRVSHQTQISVDNSFYEVFILFICV